MCKIAYFSRNIFHYSQWTMYDENEWLFWKIMLYFTTYKEIPIYNLYSFSYKLAFCIFKKKKEKYKSDLFGKL